MFSTENRSEELTALHKQIKNLIKKRNWNGIHDVAEPYIKARDFFAAHAIMNALTGYKQADRTYHELLDIYDSQLGEISTEDFEKIRYNLDYPRPK